MKNAILLTLTVILLAGCAQDSLTRQVLEGSTHACGTLHVEGYFSDSQGEVTIAKFPDTWTPEQIREFCNGGQVN